MAHSIFPFIFFDPKNRSSGCVSTRPLLKCSSCHDQLIFYSHTVEPFRLQSRTGFCRNNSFLCIANFPYYALRFDEYLVTTFLCSQPIFCHSVTPFRSRSASTSRHYHSTSVRNLAFFSLSPFLRVSAQSALNNSASMHFQLKRKRRF